MEMILWVPRRPAVSEGQKVLRRPGVSEGQANGKGEKRDGRGGQRGASKEAGLPLDQFLRPLLYRNPSTLTPGQTQHKYTGELSSQRGIDVRDAHNKAAQRDPLSPLHKKSGSCSLRTGAQPHRALDKYVKVHPRTVYPPKRHKAVASAPQQVNKE